MRIHVHTEDQYLTDLTVSQKTFLKNVLLPESVNTWSSLLQVKNTPLVNNSLKLLPYCDSYFPSDKGCIEKCHRLYTATCGRDIMIPPEHLQQREYCEDKTGDTYNGCLFSPDGPGVKGVDYILYVSAIQLPDCESIGGGSAALAWAGSCWLSQIDDRPIAGFINFCPSSLASEKLLTSTDKFRWQEQRATAIHEIAHALGFSGSMLANWRYPDGTPRTKRNECGIVPQTVIDSFRVHMPSENTLKITTEHGVDRMRVVTPTVVATIRSFFNCETLEGAELENQAPYVIGSHWEERIFNTEVMSGVMTSGHHGEFLSNLTLAFFKDSGWYEPDFSSPAVKTPAWGYHQGCDFATQPCVLRQDDVSTSVGHPFCTEFETNGCSADHRSIAYCDIKIHSSPITPAAFRYFSDSRVGGTLRMGDFCPYFRQYNNGDCKMPGEIDPTFNIQVRGTSTSACMMNHGLAPEGFSVSIKGKPGCFQYECDSVTGVLRIGISGGKWATCSRTNKAIFPGYKGFIKCPSYKVMCERKIVADVYNYSHLNYPPTSKSSVGEDTDWTIIMIMSCVILCIVVILSCYCNLCRESEEEDPATKTADDEQGYPGDELESHQEDVNEVPSVATEDN